MKRVSKRSFILIRKEAFRVNSSTRKKWLRRKARIKKRLKAARRCQAREKPMLAARNIHYDMADRTRAVAFGGIGAVQLLANKVGLVEAIDNDLHLLKVHLPYHESDHVLNLAYNILCDGECIQDLENLRNDEAHLDALGAKTIPDPTTAGDFCRRFESNDVVQLMDTFNRVRAGVWKQQEPDFFEVAYIDADGTIASTNGQCKEGMDMDYLSRWGYQPLVISLANTKEPLFLVNRPASRPSHEDAAQYLDKSIELCRGTGFKSIWLGGDTDFSQTAHLDRWDSAGDVKFLFGMDARKNLVAMAESLEESAWKLLERPARYEVATEKRARPENIKEKVIAERGYKHLRQRCEHVAEFEYQPVKCGKAHRVISCRKTIDVERNQQKMWVEYRYFFHITNDWVTPAAELVLQANKRCDQENLIEQLKNGVKAMRMPVGDLVSNWAYMVMASLAWSLKAWWGLMLPEGKGRGREARRKQKHQVVRMEFKGFVAAVVRLPCQIIRGGRRLIYRLLSYSPWQEPLLAAVVAWRTRTQC